MISESWFEACFFAFALLEASITLCKDLYQIAYF